MCSNVWAIAGGWLWSSVMCVRTSLLLAESTGCHSHYERGYLSLSLIFLPNNLCQLAEPFISTSGLNWRGDLHFGILHVGIYRVCCEWGRMRRVGPSFPTICTWRGSGITTSANSLSKETRDWMEHICEDAPRKSGLICHLLACSQYLDIPDGHIPGTLP